MGKPSARWLGRELNQKCKESARHGDGKGQSEVNETRCIYGSRQYDSRIVRNLGASRYETWRWVLNLGVFAIRNGEN